MLAVLGSPYVLGLVFSTAATLALAGAAYTHRKRPASRSFGVLCLLLASWAATTCTSLLVTDHGVRLFLERLHWVHALFVSIYWLAFALDYAGYGGALTRRRIALLAASAIGFVVVLFAVDPSSGFVWSSYEYVTADGLYLIDQNLGPLTLAMSFYTFALTFAGAAIILRFGLTAGHLYRDQTLALVLGVAFPILVSMFSMVDVTPLQGLNVTPYALSASAIAFGNAMYRYDFLENAPSTRRFGQHVVTKSLRDGVVVVDDGGRIVECNPVAGDVLGVRPEDALGDQFTDVVDETLVVDGGFDQNTHLTDAAGSRRYAVERSPVLDQHDHQVGHVYLLRDVTETERREERLAVLNRVLRHNLRNDMNVVDGYARDLAARLDGDDADTANAIARVAGGLVELSHKARTVEAIMALEDTNSRPLDSVVAGVVDDLTEGHRGVTVDVDVPSVPVARAAVVTAVVGNVVENAVEHGGDAPTITIEGTREDEVVELVVADDGPGIPEVELAAIRQGEESALEHGSGLGLWIVAWGVERLGGDLDIDVTGGTTVRLSLPVAGGHRDPDRSDNWSGGDSL